MKKVDKNKFNRARQRALLLVENPNFQGKIKEIRKKFNIPQEGLKTNQESEKWHRSFDESNDFYYETNRGRIGKEIVALRENRKFQEAYDLQRKYNKEAPLNAFGLAIKSILQDFKLPLHWEHSIKRYILFNSVDSMWLPGNIRIREDYDQDVRLTRLSIEIDETTTLEDIKESWPRIKHHQERLQSYTKKKNQPIKNFERDQMAYNLKQAGKSYAQIADVLSKKFDRTISYEDVGSYIKRYKEKVGIN